MDKENADMNQVYSVPESPQPMDEAEPIKECIPPSPVKKLSSSEALANISVRFRTTASSAPAPAATMTKKQQPLKDVRGMRTGTNPSSSKNQQQQPQSSTNSKVKEIEEERRVFEMKRQRFFEDLPVPSMKRQRLELMICKVARGTTLMQRMTSDVVEESPCNTTDVIESEAQVELGEPEEMEGEVANEIEEEKKPVKKQKRIGQNKTLSDNFVRMDLKRRWKPKKKMRKGR